MRLTLRTLLAYLDDTLEPSEIKQIGQKVAESDAAQELIARLKQVTRRRRLTTPPDTGKGEPFDPNTVAAYLDNELPSDQVAELEKICLESDVHLAEIAACHQILTLVLGEPALVPPTAKERMYGLVKGREAIPFRKAPAPTTNRDSDADEMDEGMMSVLAFHRQQNGWKRWALPLAGVLLFLTLPVVLIYALMQGSSNLSPTHPTQVANADKSNPDKDTPKDGHTSNDLTKDTDGNKDKLEKDGTDPNKDKKDKDTPNKDTPAKDADPEKDKPSKLGTGGDSVKTVERPAEPSKERREVATYQGPAKPGSPSILVQRQRDDKSWKRLAPNTPVSSSDQLVSLPGYTSEIVSGSGVRVQLWGTLPKFTPQNPNLFESAVVLHANPKFDLELTIDRGRVFLANVKDNGAARVRLRFEKEIWDLTLAESGTEVAIDLNRVSPPNIDWTREEPRAELRLCLLQGKAGLRVEYEDFPNLTVPGPAFFRWDSHGVGIQGPLPQDRPLPAFSKDVPANKDTNDLREALAAIGGRMGEKKAVGVVLKEIVDEGPLTQRVLSIYCMGAVDAIPAVLDVLDGKDEARGQDRFVSILVLYRWISRGLEYTHQLFDMTTRKSGILLDKKYTPNEAAIVLALLHDFNEVRAKEPETFETLADYLTHNKMAIRELAYLHLQNLSRGVKTIPPFNAAWDSEKRNRAADEWKAMVKRGELPPPAPPTGPPGGPPK